MRYNDTVVADAHVGYTAKRPVVADDHIGHNPHPKGGVPMTTTYSAAISGFCRTMSVFDAMKLVKNAGYDSIDLSLYVYAAKPDQAMADDRWWRQWVQAVGTYARELSLPVTQAHAPYEQSIPRDFSYEPPRPIYARMLEACSLLSCQKLVFHPLLYPYSITSPETLQKIHAYNLRWFRELLPLARHYGVVIELENTFDYYHLQGEQTTEFPFTRGEHMLALAEGLDADLVKFCLDTGHANINRLDVPEMIRTLGGRLDCLHLNDNLGPTGDLHEDLHLFPGEGTLSWPPIYAALKQIGYQGVLNLEVVADLYALPPEKIQARLQQGRETLARDFGA